MIQDICEALKAIIRLENAIREYIEYRMNKKTDDYEERISAIEIKMAKIYGVLVKENPVNGNITPTKFARDAFMPEWFRQ